MLDFISIDDLTVRFDLSPRARPAVDALRIHVAEGESFGIVGESGSGKTTVLRVIAGIQTATQGAIRMRGEPLGVRRSLAQRREIQMVFQDPYGSLHPRQTVNAILKEPLRIHKSPEQDRKVAQALDAVGLSQAHRQRYPNQLSGGQRQRVAIARALILQPSVLLLDEPTSALDVSVQAEILNLLNEIRRRYKMTLVVVTHDLGVVLNLCDRVAVLKEGRLVDAIGIEQLASGTSLKPYTMELVEASKYGFRNSPDAMTEVS